MRLRSLLPLTIFALCSAGAAWADSLPVVHIEPGASGLDPRSVREAIDTELARSAAARAAGGTLEVKLSARRHARLAFTAQSGRVTEREIDLPEEPARAREAIALLAGNLARDEASEILAGMQPEPEPEPDASNASSPEPTSPPPSAPPVAKPAPPIAKPASNPQPSSPAARDSGKSDSDFIFDASLWGEDASTLDNPERRRVNLELGIYSHVGTLKGAMFGLGYGRVQRKVVGFAGELGWIKVGQQSQGVLWALGGSETHGLEGAQLATGVNLDYGALDGVQAAAGANYTRGPLEGVQLALVNVGGTLSGAQVGLVNVGGHVQGAQVGLVNVADKVDGIPLGLVNVVNQGRTSAVTWGDSAGFAHVGVKYLNGPVYTMFAVGHSTVKVGGVTRDESREAAASVILGGELRLGSAWYLDLDVGYTGEGRDDFRQGSNSPRHVGRYRALIGFDPNRTVGVFAGGGLEHATNTHGDTVVRPYAALGLQIF